MFIESDKHEFYFKQAKSNLTQKYKNLHKNSYAPSYLFSLSRVYKVQWDKRARWTFHARKLVRATLFLIGNFQRCLKL